MNFEFTTRALRDITGLSPQLRSRLNKQLALLQDNLRHPSLQAKKYDDANDIWQGRVTRDYLSLPKTSSALDWVFREN